MPRITRVAATAVLAAIALAASLVALVLGGGAAPPALIDPGVVVRVGLPVAKLLADLGFGAVVGALAVALFALRPGEPAYGRVLDVAAGGAAVWTVAGAGAAYFSFASLYTTPPSLDNRYGAELWSFLTQTVFGRAWLVYVIGAALVTVLCFALRSPAPLAGVGALAVLAVVPLAKDAGHAASLATHDIAVSAILLHLLGAGVWLGGLLAIALARDALDGSRLAAVLPRYSTLALLCFVVVAASGVVSAAIRIGDVPSLASPYGMLVLVKVAALTALGIAGVLQRRALVRRIADGARARVFWLLVLAELALMGVASGVATALARTPTPVPSDPGTAPLTPAEILTRRPLPPELTPERYLTMWTIDLLWVAACGFGVAFYVAGVIRLRRRGDRWPWHRTALWVAGMLALLWVTNGALRVYGDVLFSAHMLGHMLLSMAIPVALVLAAPVTLALRAVHKRDDGSRGAREWLLAVIHSRYARVITHPLVAGGIFAGSLWVFYFTPIFRWAVSDHAGHTWMVVHFLLSGFLFAEVLVGVDPLPKRPPYPLRLVLLFATMALHAFFGLAIMTGEGLLLADWFGAMGREWGLPPLEDQHVAGGITWSVGEIPTLVLAIVVAIEWSRADAREARRRDRAADRDGEAELAAYNEMLARRAGEPASGP